MPITVAIVEDQEQLRNTLSRVLNRADGFKCVSTYGDAESALEGLPKDKPDVVLMDINLPGMNGVECARKLKQAAPQIQIVMLTVYEDTENIFNALAAGASGYMLKRSSTPELLESLREVQRGGSPMTAHIARKVVQSFQKRSARFSEPGISLQGNRRETRHQLRDGPHLRPPHLRKAPGENAHRGRGEISATLAVVRSPPPLRSPAIASSFSYRATGGGDIVGHHYENVFPMVARSRVLARRCKHLSPFRSGTFCPRHGSIQQHHLNAINYKQWILAAPGAVAECHWKHSAWLHRRVVYRTAGHYRPKCVHPRRADDRESRWSCFRWKV
jgi:DNA-binding NarL/FixJ family response regulator